MKTARYLLATIALCLLFVWSGCYTVVSRDALYRSRAREIRGGEATVSEAGEIVKDESRGERVDEDYGEGAVVEEEGEEYEAESGFENDEDEYYGRNGDIREIIHHHYYHYYPGDWRWRSAYTLSWYYDPFWDWCWPSYVYVPYLSVYYDPWYWDPWYWDVGLYWGWSYPLYHASGCAYWYGYNRGWWDCDYYYYGGGGGGTTVAAGPRKVRSDRLGTFGISSRRYYASSGAGNVSPKIRPRSAGSGTLTRRSRPGSPGVVTRRAAGDRRDAAAGRTGSRGTVKPAVRSGSGRVKTVTRTQKRRTAVSGTVSRRSGRAGSSGRTTRRSTEGKERSFLKPSRGTTDSGSGTRRTTVRRSRPNSSGATRRLYNSVDTYYRIISRKSSRSGTVEKNSAGGYTSGNFLSGSTSRRTSRSYPVPGLVGDVYTVRSGSRSSSVNGGSGSYSSSSGSASRSVGVSYRRSTGVTRSSSSRTTRSRASSSHTRRRR